jgi:hypothetical protein
MPYAKRIPQAMGPARPNRGIRKYAPGLERGRWSLGVLLKSLMDDSGIPFSLRTRSAVGESALIVARQSIYFDLFAALLNFGITPPPSGTPRTSMRMRLLPDFCTLETKKSLVRQGAGYGTLPSKGYKNWGKGIGLWPGRS